MSQTLPSATTFASFTGREDYKIGQQMPVGNGEVMYVVSVHYYPLSDTTRVGLSYTNPAVPR